MKKEFPFFANNPSLVYLDSAATTQMPQVVIGEINDYLTKRHSNVSRGLYNLSENNTADYEKTRLEIVDYFSAKNYQAIFTAGATDAGNMIAHSLATQLKKGDNILITADAHHSSLLPFLRLKEQGIGIKFIPISSEGRITLADIKKLIDKHTRALVVTHVSNVTGVIHDVKKICQLVGKHKIISIVDGAQAVGHLRINLQSIGCDYFYFSAHKMYGPTGVGALLLKDELVQKFVPLKTGGGTILQVSEKGVIYEDTLARFEAGTPNLMGVFGMRESFKWLKNNIVHSEKKEGQLLTYLLKQLKDIDSLKIVGPIFNQNRTGVVSVNIAKVHPHDLAQILADNNIMVRAGHHCAQIAHRYLGQTATLRISLGAYNTKDDVDSLIKYLKVAKQKFHAKL